MAKQPPLVRRTPKPAAVMVAALVLCTLGAPLAGGQSFESRVNASIDRCVAWFHAQANKDGSFGGPDEKHPLGRTALALLALVHAGVPDTHPTIKSGLDFLGVREGYGSKIANKSTYETGILLLLLRALGKKGYREPMHELAKWLVERFDPAHRMWGYPDGEPDLSNTQYAVLGLRVAMDEGFKPPAKIWQALIEYLVDTQDEAGGFRYRPDSLPTGSMTHAGLIILLFATEALGKNAVDAKLRTAWKRAHEWSEKNYSVEHNPMGHGRSPGWSPGDARYFYFLYGLERYAVFYGFKTVAGHDWYAEGAERLMKIQDANGSWGSVDDTAFALLFLRKAAFTPSARSKSEPPPPEAGAAPAPADAKSEPPRPPAPAADVPFIRSWLVAGPFPGARGSDEMLLQSHLPEAKLAPSAGDPAGKLEWKAYESPKDEVDPTKATKGSDFAAWYAFTWLVAEKDDEVVLWIGSDDGARVYLNGKMVLDGHHHDGSGKDRYPVPLALKKGKNRLLIKVENLGYFTWFTARLAGKDGLRPFGLQAGTDARKLK